jgi:hypothetical protein
MPPARHLPISHLSRPTERRRHATTLPNRRLPITQMVDIGRYARTNVAIPDHNAYNTPDHSIATQSQHTINSTNLGQQAQNVLTDQPMSPTYNRGRLHHPPGRRFPQPDFFPQQQSRTRIRDPNAAEPVRIVRPRIITCNRQGDPSKNKIRLATLNIISGRAERLVSAARALQQMNIDIAILTETKITDECYTRHSSGYEIRSSKARRSSQGGFAICWRDSEVSQTEGIRFHGPNVVSCEVTSGQKRWLVLGAYIPPSEATNKTVNFVQEAHQRQPRLPVILLGDLNVDFRSTNMTSAREASIAGLVANLGVEDMLNHF